MTVARRHATVLPVPSRRRTPERATASSIEPVTGPPSSPPRPATLRLSHAHGSSFVDHGPLTATRRGRSPAPVRSRRRRSPAISRAQSGAVSGRSPVSSQPRALKPRRRGKGERQTAQARLAAPAPAEDARIWLASTARLRLGQCGGPVRHTRRHPVSRSRRNHVEVLRSTSAASLPTAGRATRRCRPVHPRKAANISQSVRSASREVAVACLAMLGKVSTCGPHHAPARGRGRYTVGRTQWAE
jgi:hypothetical protein